jgi:hypothetical protein
MDPKDVNNALAPHPRAALRLRAVRDPKPPLRTISRAAARILSFVILTGLAIMIVP